MLQQQLDSACQICMLVWAEAVSRTWIYRFFFPSQCCSLPQRQLRWRRLVLHQQGCKDSHGESLFHQKPFSLTLNSPRISFFPVCPKARVKPGCGRLVGFSSGPVNPHGVTAVTSGRRCALALWFTKEKLYRDMVSAMMMSHRRAALLHSAARGCCDNRGSREQPDCDANVVVLFSCCGIYISQSVVILGQFTSFISRLFRQNKSCCSPCYLCQLIY